MPELNVVNNSNGEFDTEMKKCLCVARYALCPKNSMKNLSVSNEILEYRDCTHNTGVGSGIQTRAPTSAALTETCPSAAGG